MPKILKIVYITITFSALPLPMISNQKSEQFLKQLHELYPSAFKGNFMLYGQIKTKGVLDELKELIPWVLALTIFGSTAYGIGELIYQQFPQFEYFRAFSIAALGLTLFMMMVSPIIIKQIKHSSTSLYQQLQHTPLKLTALIILQALNIAFAESWLLMVLFFFAALSFGFVKFYKENMFRSSATILQYHELQQVRRICFWTYKQTLKINFKLLCNHKHSEKYQTLLKQKTQFVDLHVELINLENKLCMTYKHVDLEHYLDSIM